jgi:N-acetyl-gamma-glutamylphosphate reductase
MMKVAIVGATGVTGTSIVNALLSAKEDVFVRRIQSPRLSIVYRLTPESFRKSPPW